MDLQEAVDRHAWTAMINRLMRPGLRIYKHQHLYLEACFLTFQASHRYLNLGEISFVALEFKQVTLEARR